MKRENIVDEMEGTVGTAEERENRWNKSIAKLSR